MRWQPAHQMQDIGGHRGQLQLAPSGMASAAAAQRLSPNTFWGTLPVGANSHMLLWCDLRMVVMKEAAVPVLQLAHVPQLWWCAG